MQEPVLRRVLKHNFHNAAAPLSAVFTSLKKNSKSFNGILIDTVIVADYYLPDMV